MKVMENKQTAVEWLEEQMKFSSSAEQEIGLTFIDTEVLFEILQKSKEIEKEQITHAYGQGVCDEAREILDVTRDAECYYNEMYGK